MNTQISKNQIANNAVNVQNGAPTVSSDETLGYAVGSLWVDVSMNNTLYVCADASAGSAVWNIVQDPNALQVVATDGTTIDGNGTFGDPLSVIPQSTDFLYTVVSLSSVEILQLFTTPKVLIANPGAGKIIEITSMSAYLDYGTVAYATNTTLRFKWSTSSPGTIANPTGFLNSTADKTIQVTLAGTPITTAGQDFVLTVDTGNPTAGDSTMKVYITYKIITL